MVFISVSSPHHEIMLNVLPHWAQKVMLHENKHRSVHPLCSYEIQSCVTKAILSFLHYTVNDQILSLLASHFSNQHSLSIKQVASEQSAEETLQNHFVRCFSFKEFTIIKKISWLKCSMHNGFFVFYCFCLITFWLWTKMLTTYK